jgi:hypothetical protein
MPLPSTSYNYVEIAMLGTSPALGSNAKPIDNIYHFKRQTNVPPISKTNIESSFQTWIATPVLATLSIGYTQTFNAVRLIDDALDPPALFPEAGVGAISGDRLPDFNSVVIRYTTGLRGRSYRGSKHFGPIAESQTLGDALTSGAITLWNAVRTALISGFTDTDGNIWSLVVLSRKQSKLMVNPTTVVANVINATKLNDTLGTMRRRKVKTVA